MDLEMTGLDPERERIIEIATVVTDGDLNILAEGPELVLNQPETVLAAMDDWNRKHHGESGLIDRVRASTMTDLEAEARIVAFLKEHVGEREAPLAGNSVHQDRRFIARYMPALDAYLHYRLVDVSTIKELVARWHPDVYAKRPHKHATHRALLDIRESIEELRYYRTAAFK
jgi:oligoribonuclease